MANYERLANVAKKLIEKNGRAATLTKDSEVPADPLKPWRGVAPGTMNENEVSVPVIALFKGTEMAAGKDGVVRNFQIALVAAKSALSDDATPVEVDLTGFDSLIDGSRTWAIDRIDPVKPGTRMLLWKLYLNQ